MARRRRGNHDQLSQRPSTRSADRLRLAVRVTPKAGRDAIAGFIVTADGRKALAVRLAAPPVDGAANTALIAFLAKELGLPKSGVRIVSGESSRLKMVEIDGAPDEMLARLTA